MVVMHLLASPVISTRKVAPLVGPSFGFVAVWTNARPLQGRYRAAGRPVMPLVAKQECGSSQGFSPACPHPSFARSGLPAP